MERELTKTKIALLNSKCNLMSTFDVTNDYINLNYKKMKKLLLAFTVVCGVNLSASAQALSQGSIVADVYYGFPNLYKSILTTNYDSDANQDFSIGGYGPIGLRGEYLVSDKLGVGVDFMINSTSVSYNYMGYLNNGFDESGNIDYIYDDNGQLTETMFEDKIVTTKIGFMATLNYHIINSDRVDLCFTAGAGYKNRNWSISSTDLTSSTESVSSTVIPVAARIALNTRIFFTDNIGANIGVGFGQGGILTAGLSFAL